MALGTRLQVAAILAASLGGLCGCSAPITPEADLAHDPASAVTVLIDPVTPALSCGTPPTFQPGVCRATIGVAIANGTDEALTIDRIGVVSPTGDLVEYRFDDTTVPARGVWRSPRRLSVSGEGAHRLTAHLLDSPQHASLVFAVTNPELEAAKARCRACDGVFGAWGMAGHVGCNCRNADGGQPCNDGRDCIGDCLTAADTPSGFAGRCADLVTTFGCRNIIPDGASEQAPPMRARSICTD